jgi:hypothetical protein
MKVRSDRFARCDINDDGEGFKVCQTWLGADLHREDALRAATACTALLGQERRLRRHQPLLLLSRRILSTKVRRYGAPS